MKVKIKPSNLMFKSEFKKFADERWDIAADPTLQLTFGGAQGLSSLIGIKGLNLYLMIVFI